MPVPTKHPAQRWVGKFAHGSEVFHKNIPNICGRNYAEKGSDHFWYYVLSFFLYFYKRLFWELGAHDLLITQTKNNGYSLVLGSVLERNCEGTVQTVKNRIDNKTSVETNDFIYLFIYIGYIYIYRRWNVRTRWWSIQIFSLKCLDLFQYVFVQMDIIHFITLLLEHLNLHIFDVKLHQKPCILLYSPSKTQWKNT
jgi:hypothetical protein